MEQIGEATEDIGRRVDDVSSAQINDVDIDNQVRMADNIVGEGGILQTKHLIQLPI